MMRFTGVENKVFLFDTIAVNNGLYLRKAANTTTLVGITGTRGRDGKSHSKRTGRISGSEIETGITDGMHLGLSGRWKERRRYRGSVEGDHRETDTTDKNN